MGKVYGHNERANNNDEVENAVIDEMSQRRFKHSIHVCCPLCGTRLDPIAGVIAERVCPKPCEAKWNIACMIGNNGKMLRLAFEPLP